MFNSRLLSILVILAGSSFFACSDDDKSTNPDSGTVADGGVISDAGANSDAGSIPGSGSNADSGLGSSRGLNTLNEAEYEQLCEEATAALNVNTLKELFCFNNARIAAEADATIDCSTFAQDCIADPANDLSADGFMCDQLTLSDIATCTGNIADVERCATDSASAFETYSNGVDCSNIVEKFEDFQNSAEPASCTSLDANCPELFNTPDEDPGSI